MNPSKHSLVSVIIPTHNRAAKVLRAIESVLRQSYSHLELIVVDDGSTDETRYWLEKIHDDRLQVFFEKHGGVARARNCGVQHAKGDWLCFLDSDDLWHRHKLSEQVRLHADQPKLLLSQTDDVWIRNSVRVNKMKKHEIREGSIFEDSLHLCLVCCSSVMIHKSIFNEAEGFDETLPTCEDYDLWLRLLCRYPIGFVAKKLVTKFGGHADQLSKKFEAMDRYRIQSLEKILKADLLSPLQRGQACAVLEQKKAIVLAGAQKRQ